MNAEQLEAFKAKYRRMDVEELWADYFRVIDRIEKVNKIKEAPKNEGIGAKKKRADDRTKNWFAAENQTVTAGIILEILEEMGEDVD